MSSGSSKRVSSSGSPPRKRRNDYNRTILSKYEFKVPKHDDPSAEFDQTFLSKPLQPVLVFMCDRCQSLAKNFTRKIVEAGRKVICLPVCKTCILTNRRVSQTVFFNVGLKNAHDYVRDEDENGGDDEEEEAVEGDVEKKPSQP